MVMAFSISIRRCHFSKSPAPLHLSKTPLTPSRMSPPSPLPASSHEPAARSRRGLTVIADDENAFADTLIIGGGPVGLSTAYHLASHHRDGEGSGVTVIERDPTYARCSATLSAGGIRQQFSLRENVEMSLYGRDFMRRARELLAVDDDDADQEEAPDLQFQEHGYLFLAGTSEGRERMIRSNAVQRSAGADVRLMDLDGLRRRFPWMNVEDVLLGSIGESGEGWFDPWALIRGLRRKCRGMGVRFVTGAPAGAARDRQNGRVQSVDVIEGERGVVRYGVCHVVNASGAHCAGVMRTLAGDCLAHPIPVEPRKRCIFFLHCNTRQDAVVPRIAPLTVCPTTGVYFRSEGLVGEDSEPTGNFLCGVSPPQDVDRAINDLTDIDYADHELWDNIIWPALYHRVPAFGDVRVKSSWAGLYEYNTLDQNAIIGFHPEMENVLMVNGFSGHGLQQSPATGRAAAELISCGGKFATLDLSVFSFERCLENSPVFEAGIV